MASSISLACTTPVSIVLAAIAVLGCYDLDVDRCLDLGGSYDYQLAGCDRDRGHPGPRSACHVCAKPSYQTDEIGRPDFEERFRVSSQALGLANQRVCVTNVSCAGEGPNPGSQLIHGRDELLAFRDGVYFQLRRSDAGK